MKKHLFICFSIHIIFILLFSVYFFNLYNFLPFEYEIDTFVYSNISESIREFSIPIPETFGMSPVYPVFISVFSIFNKNIFNILSFNILISFLLIYFLYSIVSIWFSSGKSFIFTLLIISNPFFHNMIFSGFSELLFYTVSSAAILLSIKNKNILSMFANILAIHIRPEFLLINIMIVFINKKSYKKNIILSIIFFLIISYSLSLLSPANNIPFFNKFRLFTTMFEEYSNASDKDVFLQRYNFLTGETYSQKKLTDFFNSDSAKKDITKIIISFSLNYIKNIFRVIIIFISHFHFMIILFFLYYPKNINLRFFISIISPFFIISLVPIESWEFRYFIYTIFFISLSISLKIQKKYSLLIIIALFLSSFNFNMNFYSSYSEMFNYVSFFRSEQIKKSNICSRNIWTGKLSDNTQIPSPPYAENLSLYEDYIFKNHIDYIVIDNDLIHSGKSFYNTLLINYLTKNHTRLNREIPYIFKVKNNNEKK